ncbi:MAG: tripartite tricarboxylate transporter TctB family protein [Rhodospirillales bacterium]|nr:tripartite tricarboxylate transporter TctB family protein [Rhodospirillales bacterium]
MAILKELLIPGLVFAFGAAYFVETDGLPFETVLFPHFLMWVMPVLAVLILLAEVRLGTSKAGEEASSLLAELKKPGLLVVMCAGYVVAFWLAGFLVATILFLALTMLLLRVHWLKSVVIATAFSFSLYFVFGVIFEVPI